jgi:hypothetical protein
MTIEAMLPPPQCATDFSFLSPPKGARKEAEKAKNK